MAMAIPSYAAKLGRGKVGLISSSNQLARKNIWVKIMQFILLYLLLRVL